MPGSSIGGSSLLSGGGRGGKERPSGAGAALPIVPCFSDDEYDDCDDNGGGALPVVPCYSDDDYDDSGEQCAEGAAGGRDGGGGSPTLHSTFHSRAASSRAGASTDLAAIAEGTERQQTHPASSSSKKGLRRGRRWVPNLSTRRRKESSLSQSGGGPGSSIGDQPQDRSRNGLDSCGSDRTGTHLRKFTADGGDGIVGEDVEESDKSDDESSAGLASEASEGMLNRYLARLKKKTKTKRARMFRRRRDDGSDDGENDDISPNFYDDDEISAVDSDWDPRRDIPDFVEFGLGEDEDDEDHRLDADPPADENDDRSAQHGLDDRRTSLVVITDCSVANNRDDAAAESLRDALRSEAASSERRVARPLQRLASQKLESLSPKERKCLSLLQARFAPRFADLGHNRRRHAGFTDELLLDFAQFHAFRVERASSHLQNFDADRFLGLTARGLEGQLKARVLFPLPAMLRTKGSSGVKGGMPVFYMKPSRHLPKGTGRTRTRTVINNLAYVMNSMVSEESRRDSSSNAGEGGLAFLANMDHFTMKNFSLSYWGQLMQTLQGRRLPIRVKLFLIVNPPGWFDGLFSKLISPMLSSDFRSSVKMIREEELGLYLGEGYERYLPDDMKSGGGDTAAIVKGFVQRRNIVEQQV